MTQARITAASEQQGLNFSRTAGKIVSFGRMLVGWHYGRGVPAPGKRVSMAIDYLNLFSCFNLYDTDAFPGADGEIAVTAYFNNFFLRVGLESDGTVTVLLQCENNDIIDEDNVSVADSYALIEKAAQVIESACHTSDSSIQEPTTQGSEDLITTPLRRMEKTEAFQLLTSNVCVNQKSPYVNIYENTMTGFPVSRQYSGSLNDPNLRFLQKVGT